MVNVLVHMICTMHTHVHQTYMQIFCTMHPCKTHYTVIPFCANCYCVHESCRAMAGLYAKGTPKGGYPSHLMAGPPKAASVHEMDMTPSQPQLGPGATKRRNKAGRNPTSAPGPYVPSWGNAGMPYMGMPGMYRQKSHHLRASCLNSNRQRTLMHGLELAKDANKCKAVRGRHRECMPATSARFYVWNLATLSALESLAQEGTSISCFDVHGKA